MTNKCDLGKKKEHYKECSVVIINKVIYRPPDPDLSMTLPKILT